MSVVRGNVVQGKCCTGEVFCRGSVELKGEVCSLLDLALRDPLTDQKLVGSAWISTGGAVGYL
jgi:hypothetical protein